MNDRSKGHTTSENDGEGGWLPLMMLLSLFSRLVATRSQFISVSIFSARYRVLSGHQRSLKFRVMVLRDIPLRSRMWKNIKFFGGSVQLISRLDSQSKFQRFTLFSGRHVDGAKSSILGSVNLRKALRRISEVWGHAETQNLEKCIFTYLL